jgi:hypothetical protein
MSEPAGVPRVVPEHAAVILLYAPFNTLLVVSSD